MDEIIKIGVWKTEKVATHYFDSTTSTWVVAPKRQRDNAYAAAVELPLPPAFEEEFSACAPKYKK